VFVILEARSTTGDQRCAWNYMEGAAVMPHLGHRAVLPFCRNMWERRLAHAYVRSHLVVGVFTNWLCIVGFTFNCVPI